ncbi:MAG: amidohydrolase [SAR202 cluster bacterium]|nr:amidohydrolase [SAR202 cluster bacterium]
MRNGFRVIDADAHFYEPKNIWDKYVEKEFYDRRPIVTDIISKARLVYKAENKPFSAVRANTLYSEMENKFGHAFRAGWTLESRLIDMDTEGWDIQVCLPTNAAALPGDVETDVLPALHRAYNNWAYDFCSGSSKRVRFTAIVPGTHPKEMVKESVRTVEKLGAVSVFLPRAIPDKQFDHPDYAPFFDTVQGLDVPISVHGNTSAGGEPAAAARYAKRTGAYIALSQAIQFPVENMINFGHFIYGGLLDKYPTLRLLILESNSGWVPFWLNRLEKYCEGRQSVWFDEHPLKHTPQEYFLRQCAVAADADEPSIKYVVDYIGDNNIVFNTDYPHPDAPSTSAPLKEMLEQPLSDDSKRKILWDNSVKIYGKRLIEGHPLA